MKYTKNDFKRKIKEMRYQELKEEYEDVNLQIMKARYIIAQNQNPNEKGTFPIKILKWKRAVLTQELLKHTRK